MKKKKTVFYMDYDLCILFLVVCEVYFFYHHLLLIWFVIN